VADLIIDTRTATGAVGSCKVTIEPTDLNGTALAVFDGDGVQVRRQTGRTDSTGTLTLDVTPTDEIIGTGRYYTVTITDSDGGEWTFLIEKSDATQTLYEALVVDPDDLGLAAGLDNLVDVTVTAPTARDVLGWDADLEQWVPIEVVGLTRPTVAGIGWGFGHSIANIGSGARTATLSGAHSAGDDVLTVATAGTLSPGKWRIRESGDQNSEHVFIAEGTDCTGTVVKITTPLANAHANGVTVVDPAPYCGERIGRMLAADYRNRAISGSTLCKAGAPGSSTYGGFNRPLRELPAPPGLSGASTSPAPGFLFELIGLNDDGDANLTAAGAAAIHEAFRHAMRAVLARAALGRLFESETAFPASSIFTTFAGTWATVLSTTQNTGTGYESGVGTITHALPASWAGPAGSPTRCVGFGFIGNYVGGGFAASEITFTLDGDTVHPIGSNAAGPYSASNPFTTVDQSPAILGTGIPCVARIPVTPTGGAQTIVATTGAGGACLDWIGWEADFIMPTIWPNVFVTPGCTAQQTAAIPLLNAVIDAVAAEFDSPYICVPDLYEALSPGGVPASSSYWNTAIDTTHPDVRGHQRIAEVCVEAFQALDLTIAQKASL